MAASSIQQDFFKLPATRAMARAIGASHYFNGKKCVRGHVAPRTTLSCNCTECATELKVREDIRRKNREYARAHLRTKAHKALTRHHNLRRIHGIGAEDYDAMLAAQGGRCAICRSDDSNGVSASFHVDHCHKTGKLRGLLCQGCNLGIGMFKDSAERLVAAAEYVKAHV